jgi:3-oxoadipate enol-lactonase
VLGPVLPLVAASLPPWFDALLPGAFRGTVEELAHPSALVAVLQEFSRHDWRWYRHLALGVAEHEPLDVSVVGCPVTFLAGRYDSLVDVADLRTAARTVSGARLRELPGTHFLPLQYPWVMLEELRRLTGR